MRTRPFGKTGLFVSERSFGGWAIGGASFGAVNHGEALRALAHAEELGCNLVDTAAVYGESESILGEFLPARRERWVLASKYSGQAQGMTTLVEEQLRRMRTDRIDFYQIHWVPRGKDETLYEELERLKTAGKIRFSGVSLGSISDIDFVLGHPELDGFQVCFSLLDPDPVVARLARLRERRPAVIARSVLKDGFLTGKYSESATFPDTADQRHRWDARRIATTARQASTFRFVAEEAGSTVAGAIAYPLSFPEISTVVLSVKGSEQADMNFGGGVPAALSAGMLERIEATQRALGVYPSGALRRVLRAIGRRIAWRR